MFQQTDFEEIKMLKATIKSQVLEMKELYETISSQAKRLSELAPENEILKNWIEELTHFARVEINEIIRIEKFFPGTIEHAVAIARKEFNREVHFDDFIEGAKEVALNHLKKEISKEQREILMDIKLDAMTIEWGKVKEYSLENLTLAPKDLQDLFAVYIYNGTEHNEKKLIENCRIAYAVFATQKI